MKSTLLSVNWKDLVKGFIMAMLAFAATTIYQAINNQTLEFTWLFWMPIFRNTVGAGLIYIIKNYLTNSDDEFMKREQK